MIVARTASVPAGSALRSIGAVFAGFVIVTILSLGVDQALHMANVYPPWGEPMYENKLNLLALSYRLVFNTLGSYIMARLAPRNPMKHVWVGAVIGFVLSMAGALATMGANLGPMWYPVILACSAFPTAWLGGNVFLRSQNR